MSLRACQIGDQYRNLVASLPVSSPVAGVRPPLRDSELQQWAEQRCVSELDYGFLVYHYCRLGDLGRADSLFLEMSKRMAPTTLVPALLLHHAASFDPDNPETLVRLRALLDSDRRASSTRLSPTLLTRLVTPYEEAEWSSVLCKPLRWPLELRVEHAQSSVRCYQLLAEQGFLDDPDALPVYHRLMRLLVEARMYVQCRSVYADMTERGIRQTAEGYRLLMLSLVRELDEPAFHGRDDLARSEDAAHDEVIWRKRQLLKLKFMTLRQQLSSSRVAFTADHFALLIDACCRVRDSRHALLYYQQMRSDHLPVPSSVHHALLAVGLDAAVERDLIDDMRQGFGVDQAAFELLLQAARRRVDLDNVVRFLDKWKAHEWLTRKGTRCDSTEGMRDAVRDVLRGLRDAARAVALELGMHDVADSVTSMLSAKSRAITGYVLEPPHAINGTQHKDEYMEILGDLRASQLRDS